MLLSACGDGGTEPPDPHRLSVCSFQVQPTTTESGVSFSLAPVVVIQDQQGNTVSSTMAVTLALDANPTGATLRGTTTVNAVAGVATFSNLSIDRPGTGFRLVTTSPGLTSATSDPIDVTLTLTGLSAGSEYSRGVSVTFGALVNGSGEPQYSPVPVSGDLEFIQISSGQDMTCGVTTESLAYCWGYNGRGQLGDGTQDSRPLPTPVTGGLNFTQISTGYYHTCGVTLSQDAYCWGHNGSGRLGDGTTEQHEAPALVTGGIQFVHVSVGFAHTCGLSTTNVSYCWGKNDRGQVGDGTANVDRHVPTLIVQ